MAFRRRTIDNGTMGRWDDGTMLFDMVGREPEKLRVGKKFRISF